ncbi:MAG TPA: hypothetical protein VGS28_02005 [Candidatus Saccharimonadales bacterium]|nr:hypothetical protein [Candidatus Saccharimonadales bacterium]
MKVMVLYRSNSESDRQTSDFLHDYERQTGKTIQAVNADDVEGSQTADLYEVVNYPAIIVTADDGSLIKIWQGPQLPTISEVSYYAATNA